MTIQSADLLKGKKHTSLSILLYLKIVYSSQKHAS